MAGDRWRDRLGLAADEQPLAVIVEGTWWREQRTKRRLAHLNSTRELGLPAIHIGHWSGSAVLYACPYGAPGTAEIVHMAALVGVRLAIQIGTCGVIGERIAPGDVIVPTEARGEDGVTRLYASETRVPASSRWGDVAATALDSRDVPVRRGPTMTWPTLFNQPLETVREWQRQGYLGVDMETATTLAVARHFGVPGISMLVAWDEVLSSRSFMDPLPAAEAEAFARADDAVFDAALEVVTAVSAEVAQT